MDVGARGRDLGGVGGLGGVIQVAGVHGDVVTELGDESAILGVECVLDADMLGMAVDDGEVVLADGEVPADLIEVIAGAELLGAGVGEADIAADAEGLQLSIREAQLILVDGERLARD